MGLIENQANKQDAKTQLDPNYTCLGVHLCVSSCTENTLRSKHPHLKRSFLGSELMNEFFSFNFPYFPNFLQ